MQPAKTDMSLEGILARVAFALNCTQERGDYLGEAIGGGGGGGRGALGAEGGYLCLRSGGMGEA